MSWLPYLTMTLLMFVGLFLIFIVLLQRGRGGGLAGALGGMGGTSAFGTRAGDVFTKITIGVAIVWTVLAAVNVWVLGMNTTRFKGGSLAAPTAPALTTAPGGQTPGDSLPESETGAAPAQDGTASETKVEPDTFNADPPSQPDSKTTTPDDSSKDSPKPDGEAAEKSEPK